MQRCWACGIFLAVMALLTPWQGAVWPEVRVPLLAARHVDTSAPAAGDGILLVMSDQLPAPGAGRTLSVSTPMQAPASRWIVVAAVGWSLGAGVLLLRLVAGAWMWRRLWMKGTHMTLELPEGGPRLQARLSQEISTPMVAGRKILLPASWTLWTPEEQAAAVAHELAHVRHRDGVSRWLAELAVALHWPSPLVWLGRRELRLAQEQRCDEAVLAAGVDAMLYGRLLMRCARESTGGRVWTGPVAASMARPGQLARRLVHLAEGAPLSPATGGSGLRHILWPLLVACACLQVLHVRLVAEPVMPTAGKEAGRAKELVGIEVKFVTISSDLPRNVMKTAGQKTATGIRRMTREQHNAVLSQLLAEEKTSVVSYPRMIAAAGHEAVIRSVITMQGHTFTLDKLGKTGLLCVGTMLIVTPRVDADGSSLRLEGTLGLNSKMRDLGEGQYEHEGQRTDIDEKLAAGDSLLLGPFKPVDREAGRQEEVWVSLTVSRLSSEAVQEDAAKTLRSAPAKDYNFKQQRLEGQWPATGA